MSHEKDPTKIDTAAFRVKYGGAECLVVSPEKIFASEVPGDIVIYDEVFVNSSVERATLISEKRVINGDSTFVYSGILRLNGEIVYRESLAEDFMDIIMPDDNIGNMIANMKIAQTEIAEVARVSDREMSDFLIKVDSNKEKSAILFGNYDEMTSNSLTEVVFPSINYKVPSHQLEPFLQVFMYLIEKSQSLTCEDQKQGINPDFPPKHFDIKVVEQERYADDGSAKELGNVALENTKHRLFLMDNAKILIREPKHRLAEIGGLREQMDEVESIIAGFVDPKIMQEMGVDPAQAIFMYGLPGTGKTMLAEAIASESEARIAFIQSTDIYNLYVGNSAKSMKEFFEKIKNYSDGKLVMVFDEIDTIISGKGTAEHQQVNGLFKQEMDNMDNPNVLIIGITNDEDSIDEALVRSGRFDIKLYLAMPDDTERESIAIKTMSRYISEAYNPFENDGLTINLKEVSAGTKDLSGADIAQIFKNVIRNRAIKKHKTGTEPAKICTEDIVEEILKFNRQ